MPNRNALISDLVIGDDYDIDRDITVIPVDAQLTTAWLTIKKSLEDDDSDAVIQKTINPTGDTDVGQITDPGNSDGVGHVLFQLTHDETAALEADMAYYYDIQVRTDTGKIYTPESGWIIPLAQVTQASES
jgi:hypothetical protein